MIYVASNNEWTDRDQYNNNIRRSKQNFYGKDVFVLLIEALKGHSWSLYNKEYGEH